MQISELYQLYLQYPSIQTDTRKLQPGDIYWALKGPNFNGNLFAEKALEMGAAYAIVDESVATHDGTHQVSNETTHQRIILVDDGLTALQALAKYHREQFQIPLLLSLVVMVKPLPKNWWLQYLLVIIELPLLRAI